MRRIGNITVGKTPVVGVAARRNEARAAALGACQDSKKNQKGDASTAQHSDIAHNLRPKPSGISIRVFDSNLAQFYTIPHSWFLYPGFSQKVNSTEMYGSLWILNTYFYTQGDPGCFQGF